MRAVDGETDPMHCSVVTAVMVTVDLIILRTATWALALAPFTFI